jgi:homocysteine S-methyltransferase
VNPSADIRQVRVLDGGMATELEQRGFELPGPLWSAQVLETAPEAILAVHLDYLRAGADCISTASYQVSAMGYEEIGRTAADAERAIRKSVEIAEQARELYRSESDRPVFIAVSLGPYGAAMHDGSEFHGNYGVGFDQLVRYHRERLLVAIDTSADFIAVETVPSLEEARAVSDVVGSIPASRNIWVSFTCKDGEHVAHGERLAECAALLDAVPGVVAVGINCTQPAYLATLIAEARKGTRKPVLVYPNSGELWDSGKPCWYGSGEIAPFSEQAQAWFHAGVQAVGGCCRTGPGHVRALRKLADAGSVS